jgi:hypothetical protein
MAHSEGTSRPAFTQCCRDVIKMLSYEDILSCTVYLPPMLFMIGPATMVPGNHVLHVVMNALLGLALSWAVHRIGHRLLMGLPKPTQAVYLTSSVRLPVTLTLPQFIWMLEIMVAAAVFSWVVARRLFSAGGSLELLTSIILFILGLALYFLPVYLGNLWIARYYPAMPLCGPTEEQVSKSLSAFAIVSTSKP